MSIVMYGHRHLRNLFSGVLLVKVENGEETGIVSLIIIYRKRSYAIVFHTPSLLFLSFFLSFLPFSISLCFLFLSQFNLCPLVGRKFFLAHVF